jgi:ribosomal protein L16 Arg81 hydroxylase
MYEFLNDTIFLENRKNKKHHIFKNVDLVPPKWNDIIQELNDSFVKKRRVTSLPNLGFVVHSGQNISGISELLQKISSLDKSVPCTAHCYISFLEISKSFGRHKDEADVIFWQMIGKTKWIIDDETTVTYELEPNDVIYVPRDMYHNVIPLSPRAGMSFGLEYQNLNS